jgi:cold shock CspA family protein
VAEVSEAATLSVGVRSLAGKCVAEPLWGAVRKMAPARKTAAVRPAERRGTPSAGRIVTLFVGQGHGFIRLTNDRHVFFHRSDVREGTSFNDLETGDPVTFELLEDDVSGPRALRVDRRRPRR